MLRSLPKVSLLLLSALLFLLFLVSFPGSRFPAFVFYPAAHAADPPPASHAIACVLPLSGRYAVLGQRALKGILAAAGAFVADGSGALRVVAIDWGSDEGRLAEAFRSAASTEGVEAVIGPVLRESVLRVGGIVEELRVPTVVFPISEKDFRDNPYFITFSFPLEEQARMMARFARYGLGAERVAVLYSDTREGTILKDVFVAALRPSRVDVVYMGTVESFMRGYEREIAWFRARPPQAVFLAAGPAVASQVIVRLRRDEELKEQEVEPVFLGPSMWNTPLFTEAMGEEGDGIFFTDFFYPRNPRWRRFAAAYGRAFAGRPGLLEYQFYEAARLVGEALREAPQGGGADVRNLLLSRPAPRGYDIVSRVDGGVAVVPRRFVLRLKGGKVRRVTAGSGVGGSKGPAGARP